MTALAGRAVLVTAANRGMGREYIVQLLDRGVAEVYAGARNAATIDLDVTDPVSVAAAADVATAVSVLINIAGIARGASVLDPDTTTLREELETNLFGLDAIESDELTRQAHARLGQPRD